MLGHIHELAIFCVHTLVYLSGVLLKKDIKALYSNTQDLYCLLCPYINVVAILMAMYITPLHPSPARNALIPNPKQPLTPPP